MTQSKKSVIDLINEASVKSLIRAGKAINSTDYAVRFYYNKRHKQYHLNQDALRHALRRAASTNAFNQAEIIRIVLEADINQS